MKVRSIKTEKVLPGTDLFKFLDKHLKTFREGSILAITSKIVSICEGRIIKAEGDPEESKRRRDELARREAELYLPPEENQYNIILAIKNNLIIPTAGIDESNSGGYYVLWPKDPQGTANKVREYLIKRFGHRKVGLIITDSKTTPLRWGTSGVAIAHSGFKALKNYIGTPDIFGKHLKITKANVMDALAVSAVLVMGEGNEQTPLAVIEDVPFVSFQKRNPTKKELSDLKISIDDDLYSPLLKSAKWRKGGKS